jgi:tRNA threonylcarbamoyladenosine biosynthesis protein TsaB
MSYILHIETATKVCSVALSKDGKLVQLQEIADDQFSHGEKLTLLIQDVIDLEKIEMKNLSAVSVSAGPGSYTGLRIGVSTAKGLCYALSIPLISIDTLTSMAQDESLKGCNKSICSMIDARRMEVFSSLFNSDRECIKPASPDVLDETT